MCGNGAQHGVAHVRQGFVVGQIARPNQLDTGLVEPALDELLGESRGLNGRNEHEQGLRRRVLTRCRNGAKSGLRSGTRIASAI